MFAKERTSTRVDDLLAFCVSIAGFVAGMWPVDDRQRNVRRRVSAFGVANILYAVSFLAPDGPAHFALIGSGLLVMIAVAPGFPRRLFSIRWKRVLTCLLTIVLPSSPGPARASAKY